MNLLHPNNADQPAKLEQMNSEERKEKIVSSNIRFFLLKARPYLLASPFVLCLLVFLVLPVIAIVVVSFWRYSSFVMTPDFVLDNYKIVFSETYMRTFLNTFRYAFIVWAITLIIAFPISYFLAFEVQTNRARTALFLLCTVPFLTSNLIRSIAWIPFLGRNGLLNSGLMNLGLIQEPIEIFLYSDLSIILSMVHIYTLFMVAPIFNTMVRIDRNLIEAARDLGASEWRIFREVIAPLSSTGMTIGTIFVVSMVLGDFATVSIMGGGQRASAGLAIRKMIASLQYPPAAAMAVTLLIVTLLFVSVLMSMVDIKKEL